MPKRSPECQFLVQYFRDCAAKGEPALFSEIEKLGVDPKRQHSLIHRAKSLAEEEIKRVFVNIRSVGYVLIEEGKSANTISATRIKKTRSQVAKFRRDLDNSSASNEGLAGAIAYSKCAFLETAVDQATGKQIEQKVESSDWKLEMKKTAQQLKEMGAG